MEIISHFRYHSLKQKTKNLIDASALTALEGPSWMQCPTYVASNDEGMIWSELRPAVLCLLAGVGQVPTRTGEKFWQVGMRTCEYQE